MLPECLGTQDPSVPSLGKPTFPQGSFQSTINSQFESAGEQVIETDFTQHSKSIFNYKLATSKRSKTKVGEISLPPEKP